MVRTVLLSRKKKSVRSFRFHHIAWLSKYDSPGFRCLFFLHFGGLVLQTWTPRMRYLYTTKVQNRAYPQQMDVCGSGELPMISIWNRLHIRFRWDILASESRNMRSIMAFVAALIECRFQDGNLLFNHEVLWRWYEQRRLHEMFRALIGRLFVKMSK